AGLRRRRQPVEPDVRRLLRSQRVRPAGEQHRTVRQLRRQQPDRPGHGRLLDDRRQERSGDGAGQAAVRGGILEPVQRREPRYTRVAHDHLQQLRADHGDTAGRSGGPEDRAVLAAVLVLSGEETRRRRWQTATAAALLVGYGGYYVCRSNLSVVAPQLLSEFGGAGIDKTAMGLISSVGVLAYAAGKGVNGVTADLVGGRRMFLGGMIGSIAATLAFGAAGGLGALVALWGLNRFIQSMGWGALVKVASHWYEPERYGRVMAVLSLGFLFGDAAGRFWLGWLVAHGAGWRMIFVAAAATLG